MELFSLPLSPHWIDFVLLVVLVEVFALRAFLSNRWTAASLNGLTANLAAGAALILALRLALTSASGGWILLCLSLSLLAHLMDVASRWHQADI